MIYFLKFILSAAPIIAGLRLIELWDKAGRLDQDILVVPHPQFEGCLTDNPLFQPGIWALYAGIALICAGLAVWKPRRKG